MKTKTSAAFTLIELLVVISIIAILASLAIPAVTGALTRGQMTQTLNNARQLQIATQTMSLDSFATGEGPSWTDDGSGSNVAVTFAAWQSNLVTGNYISSNDMNRLLSGPGKSVTTAPAATVSQSALTAYYVNEGSVANTIFLSSANWTGFNTNLTNLPYQNKGFIIMRKGGDGSIYQLRQATNSNTLGVFSTNLS